MDREIDLFWKRNFSIASILLLANRYIILVYAAIDPVPPLNTMPWTDRVRSSRLLLLVVRLTSLHSLGVSSLDFSS